ncbi:hypothetical protein [Aurantimonas sp. HBX-1]|uniref:hypothetical protein n=1 Tax=Aurantimonas sp. HBX-1 TaxID=2906072 RepID=UPI001F157B8C|nr:hypothetical protein [Aurantimonas sp. HBX-1]UIJ73326.1 hypothetical protein LXB15_06700 [Aurantimonas sp. HBX-1]
MWETLKTSLVTFADLSKDALHVHFGLLILFASNRLLKKPLGHWLPLMIVLLLELCNEFLDLFGWSAHQDYRWIASLRDVLNTMLWPTIIVVAARIGRRRRQS